MIAASFAAAGAIFGGLAVQMAHGRDPALGTGTSTAQTTRARPDELPVVPGPVRELELRRRDEGIVIREQQVVAREHERSFELFGTTVRILAGGEPAEGAPPAELAIAAAEAVLQRLPSGADSLRHRTAS